LVALENVTLMLAAPAELDALEKYRRPSTPVSCCSSTWVTLFSTVSADAPGYPAEMLTLGSATSGYCATASASIAARPASMMTIEITLANTGRLAKTLASMISAPRPAAPRPQVVARSLVAARRQAAPRSDAPACQARSC